ncbi:MAG TPA: discoidin domain-containing protein [Polyangiaceae bacterium]|jgi:hypothetical protein|nr:discoidin domain-containing protein [Polyangiaceae bacterium]
MERSAPRSRGFDHAAALGSFGIASDAGTRTRRARTMASIAFGSIVALTNVQEAAAGGPVAGRERIIPDALRTPDLVAVRAADPTGDAARYAIDGRDDTVWMGRAGEAQWRWTSLFARPVHVGLLRAHFGNSPTSGVPTAFRWEVRAPKAGSAICDVPPGGEGWATLEGTDQSPSTMGELAQPTRRSWFVDAEACGLRLVVDRTNAGPPVVREVQAIESARDILRGAQASDDGEYPGFHAQAVIDGTYGGRWAGAPGKSRWALRIDVPAPQTIDRVRLVLGFDSTSVPRLGGGRSYAVAWAPTRYTLEVSEDGRRFVPVAFEPVRADGTTLPLRRRLVTFAEPRTVRALRLVMNGATGESGLPEAGAVPVVREIAAYRADDKQPVLAAPWILSINANPSGQSHRSPGGEVTNDAYHAKFLQGRLMPLLPRLRSDDRYARSLGPQGEPLDAPRRDSAGEVLEAIEGDDPLLDGQLLAQSSPPPVAVLSGSNDWDYALETGPDRAKPKFWHWDPLRDARLGGMGQLARAVRSRVAPFLGFCGGAQILALLEARRGDTPSPEDDLRTIDRVLRRTSGRPIRGFAPPVDVERAWPTDPHPLRAKIQFVPNDPLFTDLAGPLRRSTTQALPELHSDVVRPDAFLRAGPLERFEVVATSAFCAPGVVAAGPRDASFPDPSGIGQCDTVVEAFRSRDQGWPVIGAQFHAEQKDFASAAPGDPPESIADARLFLAGAFETMIDAYVRLAP